MQYARDADIRLPVVGERSPACRTLRSSCVLLLPTSACFLNPQARVVLVATCLPHSPRRIPPSRSLALAPYECSSRDQRLRPGPQSCDSGVPHSRALLDHSTLRVDGSSTPDGTIPRAKAGIVPRSKQAGNPDSPVVAHRQRPCRAQSAAGHRVRQCRGTERPSVRRAMRPRSLALRRLLWLLAGSSCRPCTRGPALAS